MRKLVVAMAVAGLMNGAAIDSLRACGGGCGSMGGGGSRAYGGRMAASRKVLAGGPSTQAGIQVARQAPSPTARGLVAVEVDSNRAPVMRTAASQGHAATKSAANPPLYSCPMHPQVQWTDSTDCPICGIKLKLKRPKSVTRGAQSSPEHAEMNSDETVSDSASMDEMSGKDMRGIDDMMCPGCMMQMDGANSPSGNQAPAASRKATGGGMRDRAGMGCGC